MADLSHTVQRMNALAEEWAARKDKRSIFLRCYSMMTANMVRAIEGQRFQDKLWVEQLLNRFAEYYFEALACFDCGESVPKVWQVVHDAAEHKQLHVLQHLFLGVNAHINYDLVLSLYEMLHTEWDNLSEAERQSRYQDHNMVNTIIEETIDLVQDEVVEEHAPYMDLIDKAMGRLDEKLITGMIRRWRKSVWQHTLVLLNCAEEQERLAYIQDIEKNVLKNARWLQFSV